MAENNETREVAIRLSGVKKMYRLGQIGGGSLQADLQSWWARKRGREDPNTKIGQEQRLVGQSFMALNGIDLTIYKGEALGIIGSNGAGKSTMLKLLCRVTAPTEGEIDIYGRIASMLEVGTGFNGEMTGRENVYMNGAILGMTKAEIDAKMEDIIEFSEVREFIDTPVKLYSSGMYVKLAFSVAAHLDSEIMIMDEVLAVGDMAFQKKCLDKMREAANKEGRTVLYVSHNMSTIRQLCDRCIVLDKGKIVFDGDVEGAIRVYSPSDREDSLYREYESYERPFWLDSKDFRFRSAEFLKKNDTFFHKDETMALLLRWQNHAEIENLCLRLEVRTPDETGCATYVLDSVYSGHTGETAQMKIELDISPLMEARYHFVFTAYCRDPFGNFRNLDCVPGLSFSIIAAAQSGPGELVWNVRKWGYIKMAESFVRKVQVIAERSEES